VSGRRLAALLLLPALAAAPAWAGPAEDAYAAGYATAVLERELGLTAPALAVADGVLTVEAAALAGVDRARALEALSRVRGVRQVVVREASPGPARPAVAGDVPAPLPPPPAPAPPLVLRELQTGVLPGGELFRPLIADPRWPHFSAAGHYYLNERDVGTVGSVSFGESFVFYRGRLGSAWWETGLQAAVFSVFDLEAPSYDLINSDYFVAIPLGLRYNDASALLRLFHQSSHLGDEFVLGNRVRERVNLSYEGIDARLSYEFGDVLRLYGGFAYLFHREPPELQPWSTQVGLELRSPWPPPTARWRPIAGVDIQQHEETGWDTDYSVRAGVQIDGALVTRDLQILLEYFRGRSPNGQFYREQIEYFGLGLHFHF
jgi:hypothetical protein